MDATTPYPPCSAALRIWTVLLFSRLYVGSTAILSDIKREADLTMGDGGYLSERSKQEPGNVIPSRIYELPRRSI